MKNINLPKIALGAWSWGTGAAGGDQVFGNHLFEEHLKPVYDKAMQLGLNLWTPLPFTEKALPKEYSEIL